MFVNYIDQCTEYFSGTKPCISLNLPFVLPKDLTSYMLGGLTARDNRFTEKTNTIQIRSGDPCDEIYTQLGPLNPSTLRAAKTGLTILEISCQQKHFLQNN